MIAGIILAVGFVIYVSLLAKDIIAYNKFMKGSYEQDKNSVDSTDR